MKENNRKIRILFVCGYGVGTSVIMETNVRKALAEKGIEAEMEHAAGGEICMYQNWADIIGISKKLISVLQDTTCTPHVIEIVNLMDGKAIAEQIEAIMKVHFPQLL